LSNAFSLRSRAIEFDSSDQRKVGQEPEFQFGKAHGRKRHSGTISIFLVVAIAIPVVALGFYIPPFLAHYQQAMWYAQLEKWYTAKEAETRKDADKFARWAEDAKSGAEVKVWAQKAKEMIEKAAEHAKKASQAREKSSHPFRFI